MISQITPAGLRPARRVRSTEASVCPALTKTPPFLALSGKICPGVIKSDAFAPGSINACTVLDLSDAEIPVVTPLDASTEIAQFVSSFWCL